MTHQKHSECLVVGSWAMIHQNHSKYFVFCQKSWAMTLKMLGFLSKVMGNEHQNNPKCLVFIMTHQNHSNAWFSVKRHGQWPTQTRAMTQHSKCSTGQCYGVRKGSVSTVIKTSNAVVDSPCMASNVVSVYTRGLALVVLSPR